MSEQITITTRKASIVCEVDAMAGLRILPDQLIKLGGGGGLRAYSASSKYNWYVDSVAGSDDNLGTSPNIPFATIAKLATVMQAGQSVGLARGSVWHEQLTIPGAGCRVVAYGTGDNPKFWGSDTFANAGFTKTDGYTNLYHVTISTNYIANESQFIRAWEDNVTMTRATGIINCDSNANTYYCVTDNATSITVYIHASDNSSVITNGKTYDITTRRCGVYSAYASTWLEGVTCERGAGNNGVIIMAATATIKDCEAIDGGKHNLLVRQGSNLENVTMRDAYYNAGASLFILNADTPNGETTTLTNCTMEMTVRTQAWWNLVAGAFGHNNVSGSFGTVMFVNCTFRNLTQAVTQFANTAGQSIVNCTFTDCKRGFGSLSSVADTINIIGCTWASAVNNQHFINIEQSGLTVNVDDCSITFNASTDVGTIYLRGASTVNVTDSTFNIAANYTGVICYVESASATINLLRNVYTGAVNYVFTYWFAVIPAYTSNYNTFKNVKMYLPPTTYSTLADWQTFSGQDANSVVA